MIVALVCWIWIGLCALWFCAAMYELIRFTLLQDAYGQHTAVFRAAYGKSAVIALILGLPATIAIHRIRRKLRVGKTPLTPQ
jgi:hypothetical protein